MHVERSHWVDKKIVLKNLLLKNYLKNYYFQTTIHYNKVAIKIIDVIINVVGEFIAPICTDLYAYLYSAVQKTIVLSWHIE